MLFRLNSLEDKNVMNVYLKKKQTPSAAPHLEIKRILQSTLNNINFSNSSCKHLTVNFQTRLEKFKGEKSLNGTTCNIQCVPILMYLLDNSVIKRGRIC